MTDTPKPANESVPPENADLAKDETKSWEALEGEIGDLKDRLLRAAAETENVRKRAERERAEALQYASARFAKDILSVADNLRRALTTLEGADRDVLPEAVQNLLSGVELTERELLSVFGRHGIKSFDPTGQKFDAHLHEAMFEIPGTDQPPGTILQVIEAGYMIGERLLRPARVGVAKGGIQPESGGGGPKVDTKA